VAQQFGPPVQEELQRLADALHRPQVEHPLRCPIEIDYAIAPIENDHDIAHFFQNRATRDGNDIEHGVVEEGPGDEQAGEKKKAGGDDVSGQGGMPVRKTAAASCPCRSLSTEEIVSLRAAKNCHFCLLQHRLSYNLLILNGK
jgi:hypothetical protein